MNSTKNQPHAEVKYYPPPLYYMIEGVAVLSAVVLVFVGVIIGAQINTEVGWIIGICIGVVPGLILTSIAQIIDSVCRTAFYAELIYKQSCIKDVQTPPTPVKKVPCPHCGYLIARTLIVKGARAQCPTCHEWYVAE